jgi:hypothetical protein
MLQQDEQCGVEHAERVDHIAASTIKKRWELIQRVVRDEPHSQDPFDGKGHDAPAGFDRDETTRARLLDTEKQARVDNGDGAAADD